MDNKKFTIEVNKATYLIVTLLFLVLFVKNKNNAPIEGNKISEERIGTVSYTHLTLPTNREV